MVRLDPDRQHAGLGPAVGHNPGAGTLELFASGGGPGLLHLPQSAPGSWAGAGDWQRVPAPGELALSARPSVTVKGPNLQVCALFVKTVNDMVQHVAQNAIGRWPLTP